MRKINLLLPVLAILLMAVTCKDPECDEDFYKQVYETCNRRLKETQAKYENLSLNWIKLVQRFDSLIAIPEDKWIECISNLDSLQYIYDYLNESWIELVHMYDLLKNLPPDTVVFIPQCTLCYKDTVSINGIQYYIGYDEKHYKLYQDEDTVIRQVFYKDTIVIRYIIKDSIVDPPEKALISIEAAGTICKNDWPLLNIEINGEPVKDIKIHSILYNEYRFNVLKHEYNIDSIRITFGNDCYVEGVEDRNCDVKSVMINYHEYLLKDITKLSGYIWWHKEDPHTVEMGSNGSILIESYRINDKYY